MLGLRVAARDDDDVGPATESMARRDGGDEPAESTADDGDVGVLERGSVHAQVTKRAPYDVTDHAGRMGSGAGSLERMLAAGGFLDPERIIETVGLLGIFAIVFAESGLLIGFFLPGDSLLFTAGFLPRRPSSVDESLHLPLVPLLIGCFVAAVAGDQVGYVFGRRVGPALFNRPDSRFFKQENVDKAQEFFDKYGAKTIVLARFVPIVRTFAPIVAGVSQMNYRTFVTFNVIGGFLWAVGVTLLGYFLGQVDVVEENLEIAILDRRRHLGHPSRVRALDGPRSGRPGISDLVDRRSDGKLDGATPAASCSLRLRASAPPCDLRLHPGKSSGPLGGPTRRSLGLRLRTASSSCSPARAVSEVAAKGR